MPKFSKSPSVKLVVTQDAEGIYHLYEAGRREYQLKLQGELAAALPDIDLLVFIWVNQMKPKDRGIYNYSIINYMDAALRVVPGELRELRDKCEASGVRIPTASMAVTFHEPSPEATQH